MHFYNNNILRLIGKGFEYEVFCPSEKKALELTETELNGCKGKCDFQCPSFQFPLNGIFP